MTIEPSAVRFTVGTKVIPPKEKNDNRRAELIARYPHCFDKDGRANLKKLADMENAGLSKNRDGHGSEGMTTEGRNRIAAFRRADGQRTLAILLDAMTEPMTRADLSRKTGIAESTISHAMIRARNDGLVTRKTVHRFAIWERVT